MLTTSTLDWYFEHVPPELLDIIMELRSIIASVTPNATEVLHPKGLTYYSKERGGPVSAGICQIGIYHDHIRLAFIHGAFLPDPQCLLEGDRKYKRYVRIVSYEHADWDYLKKLIISSANFDPYSLKVE